MPNVKESPSCGCGTTHEVGLRARIKAEGCLQEDPPVDHDTQCQKKTNESGATDTAVLAIKDGLAITAWHVVNEAKFVLAKCSDGGEFNSSSVIDEEESRDIEGLEKRLPILKLSTPNPLNDWTLQ